MTICPLKSQHTNYTLLKPHLSITHRLKNAFDPVPMQVQSILTFSSNNQPYNPTNSQKNLGESG
jgi:hypothetical protein